MGHRQWYKAGCGWARLPLLGVYVGVRVSVGQGGSRRRGTHGKNRGGEDSEGRLGLLARRVVNGTGGGQGALVSGTKGGGIRGPGAGRRGGQAGGQTWELLLLRAVCGC